MLNSQFSILFCFLLFGLIGYVNGFPCCIVHLSEATCMAEEGSACQWLDTNDPADQDLLVSSQGIQCVSVPWVDCIQGNCPPKPPVPPAPSACVFGKCDNSDLEYNIQFIVDESGSVSRENFKRSYTFVENMISNDINELANLSVISFATHNDVVYRFIDAQDDSRAGVLAAIAAEKDNYAAGCTDTYNALLDGVQMFVDCPEITPSDDNVLFLLTDGQPYCCDSGCRTDICSKSGTGEVTVGAAGAPIKQALVSYNIRLVLIGIGSGFVRDKLSCLVNNPTKDIINIASFSEENFYKIESQLRDVVCPGIVFKAEDTQSILSVNSVAQYFGASDNVMSLVWSLVGLLMVGLVLVVYRFYCTKRGGKYLPINSPDRVVAYRSNA